MRLVALLMVAEIAFAHDGQIWSARSDGSEARPLTRGAQPAWSPDGSRLAYVRGRRIVVDGRPVTPRRAGVEDSAPAWSPDGRSLAFARFVKERERYETAIVVLDLASRLERRLVSANLLPRFDAVSEPEWSPDGTTIAYTHSRIDAEGRSEVRPDVRTVPAAGGDSKLLVGQARSAAFSPDGTRLAFAGVRDRNGEICTSDECWHAGEIYTAAADGSDLRRLTENEGDDADPRWSPDGSRILFSSDRNLPSRGGIWTDAEEVYSVAADGSCLTWLTNGAPSSSGATWRPGSGTDFGPGSCDPNERVPRAEAPRLPRGPGLWLGPRYRGLLLNDVTAGHLSYGDCARFEGCRETLGLTSGRACRASLPRSPRRRFRMGGATVLWDGPLHPAHLVRGGAVTIIRIDPRNTLAGVRRVVRHLRPYRGRLAPPRSC